MNVGGELAHDVALGAEFTEEITTATGTARIGTGFGSPSTSDGGGCNPHNL